MPEASDVLLFDTDVAGRAICSVDVRLCKDGRNLLIHPPKGYPTYRYDIESRSLQKAGPLAWESAEHSTGGSSAAHSTYLRTDGCQLVYRPKDGHLVKREVSRLMFDVWESPNEAVAAVLTTNGWKRPTIDMSWWPIAGSVGGGYTGQHHLEFFRLPELAPLGSVRVPFTSAGGFSGPAWAPDGKYIVFASASGDWLTVIPTGLGG